MTFKEGSVVFRRYRRGKDGKVYDAHEYGLKAWPIRGTPKKAK
jgi:hypothetical protein